MEQKEGCPVLICDLGSGQETVFKPPEDTLLCELRHRCNVYSGRVGEQR